MLADLADVVLDLFDTCGPCSGNDLDGSVGPGAAAAAAAGAGGPSGDPGEPSNEEPGRKRRFWNRRNDDRPTDDRPDHDRPGHERRLQRKNAAETAGNLAWEVASSPAGGLGRVTGPLGTVASGSEVLADGVATVQEANRRRDQIIDEQSGGYFNSSGRPERPGRERNKGRW